MIDLNNITFTVGNYEENILKIEALCESWHEDRKYVKEFGIKYNPDRAYFNVLNRSGNLVVVCIFDNDLLVGTYLGFSGRCMQDKDITMVHPLLWCIRKEYRTGELLVKFLSFLDRLMEKNGIMQYSLCLDATSEYERLGEYLVSSSNPRPFKKIETYYYRDIRR